MNQRQQQFAVVVVVLALVAATLPIAYFLLMNILFPANGLGVVPWATRGQFGDMFGALSCLLSALTLCFVAFSIWQDARERGRQTASIAWATNYQYLLEAKKLLVDHEEVLSLHGIRPELLKALGVTTAQAAYVIIDMKAADLFYRMNDVARVRLTPYREHLLRQDTYRKIVSEVVLPGHFLSDCPFLDLVRQKLGTPS